MLVTPGSERVKVLRVGKRVTAAYFFKRYLLQKPCRLKNLH